MTGWLRGQQALAFQALAFQALAFALAVATVGEAVAMPRLSANLFLENTAAAGPNDDPRIVQGGVNLDIKSPSQNFHSQMSLRVDHLASRDRELWNVSPVGNLGVDFSGETYTLSLQHNRLATISSAAQLSETKILRAGFSLLPKGLPRLLASASRAESAGGDTVSRSDTAAVSADYMFRWLSLRSGYSLNRWSSAVRDRQSSSSALLGLGGSYEILPGTRLAGDFEYNRFGSKAAGGTGTGIGTGTGTGTEADGSGTKAITQGKDLRLSADARPLSWLGLVGNFALTITDTDWSGAALPTTRRRFADFTTTVQPYSFLRFAGTVGNRSFNDVEARRNVSFATLGTHVSQQVRDGILLAANGSRTFESDPRQGENTNDNVGVSSVVDVFRGLTLRLSTNLNRSEVRTFVSTVTYDASGPLAERALFDDRPPGFTFFDTDNNDLYTKTTPGPEGWVLTAHHEPVTGRYSLNSSVQVNAIPTDKTNVVVGYSVSSSSETLGLGRMGSQSLNGSLTYLATRRASYGFSGTASLPQAGKAAYSAVATMTYRLLRGDQLSLSYGTQQFAGAEGNNNQTVSGVITVLLPKHFVAEAIASAAQLFQPTQTLFFQIRMNKAL